jgi:hypothetical protein
VRRSYKTDSVSLVTIAMALKQPRNAMILQIRQQRSV